MKVVFHLDWDEEKILTMALTNMENLRKARPDARIHFVVNGPAVHFFRLGQHEESMARMSTLMRSGVTVFLCRNALRAFNIPEDGIVPGCAVVPAGVVALIELQQQGCAYIKP